MHRYSSADIQAIYRVIEERRDMRHFLPDPVDPEVLARLLRAANWAPSVGFMQPWRFIRITDPTLRTQIHDLVETERAQTAEVLGERKSEFLRLKVEGILECGELLVAARICPNVLEYCLFSHCSGERGHRTLLQHLRADPLLGLDLRLGEGTGVAVAYPLLVSAVKFLNEMASFESAGVSPKNQ